MSAILVLLYRPINEYRRIPQERRQHSGRWVAAHHFPSFRPTEFRA